MRHISLLVLFFACADQEEKAQDVMEIPTDIQEVNSGIAVTAEPAILDFGQVKVGEGKSLTVTIMHSGSFGLLKFEDVTVTPDTSPDFLVTGKLYLALSPGEKASLTVTYVPKGLGKDTGTLVFVHNCEPCGYKTLVPLRGEGI